MRKKYAKKKVIGIMGTLILVSIFIYPIFAENTGEEMNQMLQQEIANSKVTNEETTEDILSSNIDTGQVISDVQPKASVAGDIFTANIINNGVENLPCKFKILTLPSNGNLGTVEVTTGSGGSRAIDEATTGSIELPNEVTYEANAYTVVAVGEGAFNSCKGITTTGLANNTSITSLGVNAYFGCYSLEKTGLETNMSVKNIGSQAFASCTRLTSTGLESNATIEVTGDRMFANCTALQSTGLAENDTIKVIAFQTFHKCKNLTKTGLESNATVITIESNVFWDCTGLTSTGLESNSTVQTVDTLSFAGCTGLTSTGLERNTTVQKIGALVFSGCTSLNDIVFEITTLPSMQENVFQSSGVTIYYLPETTNPEVLDKVGATVKQIELENMQIKTAPNKIEYIEGQSFNPEGLVLNAQYNYGSKDVEYSDSISGKFSFNITKFKLGDTSIQVTFDGKSVIQNITVVPKTYLGIMVRTSSSKTDYVEGEVFNPNGLVIQCIYDNGEQIDVTYNEDTKNDFSFSTIQLGNTHVTISYQGKSTSQTITVSQKNITHMTIKTKPKTSYIEEQTFDPTGLVITVTYNNGSDEDISYNSSTASSFGFDKEELSYGDTEIHISYGGEEESIAITVAEKTLVSIEIKQKPFKTEYIEGETFHPLGLIIIRNYDNGKSQDIVYSAVTKDSFSFDKDILQINDTKVLIGQGNKSVVLEIKVKEKAVASIEIKTEPRKTRYIEEEIFDPTGLEIMMHYDNKTQEEVEYQKDKENFSFNKMELSKEDTSVSITYAGKTAEQEIEVETKQVKSIAIKKEAKQTSYIEGEAFNPEGLVLVVVYNNEKGEEIAYGETTKKDFAFSPIYQDTKSVEITYGAKTVKQKIVVEGKRIVKVRIKTAPKKIEYIETERFEPEGLIITVSYNNGNKEDIEYNKSTKESFSFDKTEVKDGDREVKVSYGGKEVYQRIVVKANSIVTISIKQGPTKVAYEEGERFNPEGLILRVEYISGTRKEEVYNSQTKGKFSFNKDILKIGDQKVVIGYEGKEVEQSIFVQEQTKDIVSKNENKQVGIIETKDTTMLQGNMILACISLIVIAGIGIKKVQVRD